MRRKVSIIIFISMAVVAPLTAQEDPVAAQEEPAAAQAEPIGLRIRAFGGIVPWGQHYPGTAAILMPSFGASAGLEVLYLLPLVSADINVGLGAKFLFERTVVLENGRVGYNMLPIYAMVQLPFYFPNSDEVWQFYLAGRLGYGIFLPNQNYRDASSAATITPGFFYWNAGLGVGFTPIDLLQIFVELGYEGELFSPAQNVRETHIDVSVGISLQF